MQSKLYFLISLNLFLIFSCSAKGTNNTTLEGKWKVVDWTYINFGRRSLDNSERKGMNEMMNDLTLEFKLNQTFSTNKPEMLDNLQDKQYTVNEFNEVIIDHQYYSFIIRDNKYYFLFSNVMLQVEKIKDYNGGKIKLKKLPVKHNDVTEFLSQEPRDYETVYDIERLDTPPKLKIAEFDENCLIDCLYNSFNSNMHYFIDFSKVDKDTSFFIDFIIDTEGEISNLNIKSKKNKPTKGLRKTAKVYYGSPEDMKKTNRKVSFSDQEKEIVSSILDFENILIPGVKNGQPVNTKINLEIRLISK
ncbi:hypothetical protein [Tenacibaculum sp. M341]|uniref:hypothetical protein n=1 Tax=Tenacibaculum sp. M341 TaxID=2530339 RepID=UPI00104A5E75|nr:hypothetical protein [Tenacibaculum sp. M341]TCI84864.1 hypothetical protein EYW44_19195 [Tenacibaculum sp. M341]